MNLEEVDCSCVNQQLQNLPKLKPGSTCLFMLMLKPNIISCLVDRHFDGHAHKATVMLSLVMLLWWPKDRSLSRRIQ